MLLLFRKGMLFPLVLAMLIVSPGCSLLPAFSGPDRLPELSPGEQLSPPRREDLSHLGTLDIDIRDLVADANKHHSRKVRVGPLCILLNNLERQSYWAYEVTGVTYEWFNTSDVGIEVFYRDLPDAPSWRRYDGEYDEAIVVEGAFRLYKDNENKGAIYAESIEIISAGDYSSDAE